MHVFVQVQLVNINLQHFGKPGDEQQPNARAKPENMAKPSMLCLVVLKADVNQGNRFSYQTKTRVRLATSNILVSYLTPF